MPYPALIGEGGVFTYATRDAINALISAQGIQTQGNVYWVRPINGSDNNDGSSPSSAFQTLSKALATATANQNDVVMLCAENNTAAGTTAYQSAAIDWNKNAVHLLGVNAAPLFSQRSRIAFQAAYATAANLFTLSANGCLIQNVEFFMGVASVAPTGCMKVTGARNVIRRCQIAGMGNTANDIAGAFSLQLSGAEENLFDDCTIGQDTSQVGASVNAVIYFAAAATRNFFRKCRTLLFTNHATNCQFLRAPAGSQDRFTVFEDCLFLNPIQSASTNLTEAFTVVANGGGIILAGTTAVIGATGWNATASGNVYATGYTPVNSTNGLAVPVTST